MSADLALLALTAVVDPERPDGRPPIVRALAAIDRSDYARHPLRIAPPGAPVTPPLLIDQPGPAGNCVAILAQPPGRGYGGIALDPALDTWLEPAARDALEAAVTVAKRRRSRAYIDAKNTPGSG